MILISLNEKSRGFPTGLRVMENTQYKRCILKLESSLDTALLNDSIPLSVVKIEVCVCVCVLNNIADIMQF